MTPALTLRQEMDESEAELAAEVAAKLASQWPKLHRCKDDQVKSITPEEWATWSLYTRWEDKFAKYELKHCPGCGSTLLIMVEIINPEEE